MSTLLLALVALVLLALAVGLAGHRALDAGPQVLDRSRPGEPVDLAPFAAQIPACLRRFHDPEHAFEERDLRGRFASRPGARPDLYGAADAVFVLWIQDELEVRTTPEGRAAWAARLQAFQDPQTGRFDPPERLGHGVAHATAFATAALRLLGHRPAHPHRWAEPLFGTPEATEAWVESLGWRQIWTGSHEAGALAAVLDAPESVALPPGWALGVLDALTRRVDPATGLWKRALHDRVLRRPIAIDLGGAAHFWWLYARCDQPIPHPERALESILALQRPTGLWGTRLFQGAHPHGLDFDALNGLRLAWRALPPDRRDARRPAVLAALDRYARAAAHHLNAEGAAARLYPTPHKLVGALHAVAELNLLHRELTGAPRAATPRPWRSALDVVTWQ